MSGRRGRPPGARLSLEKRPQTPKIEQFFHHQPFAPIFPQRMAGGAREGAGSQHDLIDRTGGSGESCSQDDHPTTQEHDACHDSDDHQGLARFRGHG